MTYTRSGETAGEARVVSDLARIVDRCRSLAAEAGDPLRGVVLLGGFARGEGATVNAGDGTPRGFNDYDLLLVLDRAAGDPGRYARLGTDLAGEVEIDFVDLGLATPDQLTAGPVTLFRYELGEAHRVLWEREPGAVVIDRVSPAALGRAEASRLLGNRGMALVWAGLRLWPGGVPGEGPARPAPEHLGFCVLAAHKAVLAAGDAALLLAGRYHVAQDQRLARVTADPPPAGWVDDDLRAAYVAAVAFRRAPEAHPTGDPGALWHRARRLHETAFRAAEEHRLGAAVADWDLHPERAAAFLGRGATRRAVRGLARRLLGRPDPGSHPDEFLGRLPGLLYGAAAGSPEEHRRRLEGAVRAWHP